MLKYKIPQIVTLTLKRLFSATCQKKEIPDNV